MKQDALNYFVCKKCNQNTLSLVNTENKEIMEAILQCNSCAAKYTVKNGIPRFDAEDNYATSFGFQWNMHRKTQLDSYTGHSISRERLFGVTGWPQKMTGQVILEAGSGAGRFTEVLLETGATLYSFDYSSAVDANWANNGAKSNLNLFQADIFNIPLRKKSFDKVICLGVIQHTPNPEKAFQSLLQYVRPGGELVIDVYSKKLTALLQWKYVLRPVTKRINKSILYKTIEHLTPVLLPISILLRRIAGRFGSRIMPIVEYSNLGLSYELNKQWAILDTFDMYSPAHDHPQSLTTVKRWFSEAGFTDIYVGYGPNGVVGRGKRPE